MRTMNFGRLVVVGMALLPVGCGVQSGASELREIPPPTLPADTQPIPPNEVAYHLPNQEILQGWFGNGDLPDEGSCAIKPSKFDVSVSGNQLMIYNDETIAEQKCEGGITFTNIQTKVETLYTCDGETWDDWSQGRQVDYSKDLSLTATKLCSNGNGTLSQYVSVSFETKMFPSGAPVKFIGVASLRGENNESGCGFVADGTQRKLKGNCTYTSLSQMIQADVTGTEFFSGKMLPDSAIDLAKARFVSGSVEAKLNNWDGSISFTADTMTYKFTSGEEEVKGSVAAEN